jgi:hypothetical protein
MSHLAERKEKQTMKTDLLDKHAEASKLLPTEASLEYSDDKQAAKTEQPGRHAEACEQHPTEATPKYPSETDWIHSDWLYPNRFHSEERFHLQQCEGALMYERKRRAVKTKAYKDSSLRRTSGDGLRSGMLHSDRVHSDRRR